MAVTHWDNFGELANMAQLTGFDAVRLIGMIVKVVSTARMHKKNCRQFVNHLKLIGNLLEQLKISKLKRYSETREPLEQLQDALRKSYILVNSCQDRSYLYLLAIRWNIVYQFRKAVMAPNSETNRPPPRRRTRHQAMPRHLHACL
ncbi:hypothetical protein Syun_001922 [Stephania yunnanensis]|uniref:MCAfunc domain-containing protein n=1 Tax=Stephania yunnanensis TaxID=152371 RepID=A0AAP0LEJ6_9MAGN